MYTQNDYNCHAYKEYMEAHADTTLICQMHLRDVDEKQKETRQQIDDRDVSSTVRAKSIDEVH